jgi:hypothetical protein
VYKSSLLAQEWERRISLEFKAQAEKESKLGLPVAPYMTNLDDVGMFIYTDQFKHYICPMDISFSCACFGK